MDTAGQKEDKDNAHQQRSQTQYGNKHLPVMVRRLEPRPNFILHPFDVELDLLDQ